MSATRAARSAADLRSLAAAAGAELEDAAAHDIVAWAVEEFGGRLAVT